VFQLKTQSVGYLGCSADSAASSLAAGRYRIYEGIPSSHWKSLLEDVVLAALELREADDFCLHFNAFLVCTLYRNALHTQGVHFLQMSRLLSTGVHSVADKMW